MADSPTATADDSPMADAIDGMFAMSDDNGVAPEEPERKPEPEQEPEPEPQPEPEVEAPKDEPAPEPEPEPEQQPEPDERDAVTQALDEFDEEAPAADESLDDINQDQEWLDSLSRKNRTRWDKLTGLLKESNQRQSDLESTLQPIMDLAGDDDEMRQTMLTSIGERAELFQAGMGHEELRALDGLALLLKLKPEEGLSHLAKYAQAHAENIGADYGSIFGVAAAQANQETVTEDPQQPVPSTEPLNADMQDLVEFGAISEDEARMLMAKRAGKPAQPAPEQPPAEAPAPAPTTPAQPQALPQMDVPKAEPQPDHSKDFGHQLYGYMIDKGVAYADVESTFMDRVAPAARELAIKAGRNPDTDDMTAAEQMHYVELAWQKIGTQIVKPQQKTDPEPKPITDSAPGITGPQLQPNASEKINDALARFG